MHDLVYDLVGDGGVVIVVKPLSGGLKPVSIKVLGMVVGVVVEVGGLDWWVVSFIEFDDLVDVLIGDHLVAKFSLIIGEGVMPFPPNGLNVVRGYCLCDGIVNHRMLTAWHRLGGVVGFVPAHTIHDSVYLIAFVVVVVDGRGGCYGWVRMSRRTVFWMARVKFSLTAIVPVKVNLILVFLVEGF